MLLPLEDIVRINLAERVLSSTFCLICLSYRQKGLLLQPLAHYLGFIQVKLMDALITFNAMIKLQIHHEQQGNGRPFLGYSSLFS